MHTGLSRDERAIALALTQHGVISIQQARDVGFSDKMIQHRVKSGLWRRVHRGVYAIGASVDSWHQRAHAALLAAGEGAALCGRSAAFVMGFSMIQPRDVEIVIPHKRVVKSPARHVKIRRSRRLEKEQLARKGGFKVTVATRTLLNLARERDIEWVLDSAIHVNGRNLKDAKEYFGKGYAPKLPGRGRLRRLLAAREPSKTRTDSRLEARFRQLLKDAGLDAYHHMTLYDEEDELLIKSDFAFIDEKIIVEVDGPVHYGFAAVQRRTRLVQRLAALDWLLIPVLEEDVKRTPADTIAKIKRAIMRRKRVPVPAAA